MEEGAEGKSPAEKQTFDLGVDLSLVVAVGP